MVDVATANQAAPENHISQVASPSRYGKWLGSAFFGILIVIMLVWIWVGGHGHSVDETTHQSKIKVDYSQKNIPINTTQSPDVSEQLQAIRSKLQIEQLAEQEKLYRMRQGAPIELYSANETGNALTGSAVATVSTSSSLPLSNQQISRLKQLMGSQDANSQFAERVEQSRVETVDATQIAHTNFTVTQGTLIPGVLQTAINSDLPGMVKANVSMDVYAASGNRVLIPKGSTLMGEYNSSLSMGQRRVFVIWTRLIRPDGIDVMLGSPGTDTLGQGGLNADALETHFWARFGQASILSIIGAGIANAGVNENDEYNSASAYRSAIANQFQQNSNATLTNTLAIKPTIHIDQGARINVFVNKDLSFYNALVKS